MASTSALQEIVKKKFFREKKIDIGQKLGPT